DPRVHGGRGLQPLEQPLRPRHHGGLRAVRLRVREARVRAGADDPRLHPGAPHGGEPEARDAALARRSVRFREPVQADQPGLPDRRGAPPRHGGAARPAQEARGSLRGGGDLAGRFYPRPRSWRHCTSGRPACRLRMRPATNSRSERRLRYWRAAALAPLLDSLAPLLESLAPLVASPPSATTARSARRHTARARCAAAAARLPPGRANSFNGGRSAFQRSRRASSAATLSGLTRLWPGMLSSPPRSKSSCCTCSRVSRTSCGTSSASTRPIAQFSSSTSPRACTRGLSFATREPSPRPVWPASPVRVVIFERRCPI